MSVVVADAQVNLVEMRTVLESQEMRSLLRGQIAVSVHSKRNSQLRLRGTVANRIACDIFQSHITCNDPSNVQLLEDSAAASAAAAASASDASKSSASSVGLAGFYVNKSGLVDYRILVQGLTSVAAPKITIETMPAKNRRQRLVEDVSASLTNGAVNGWANGTLGRLQARDYELLYEGELFVNVATGESDASEMRGRVAPRLVSEAHQAVGQGAVLMTATNGTRSAVAWVNVDAQCALHYDVSLTASRPPSPSSSSRGRDRDLTVNVLELIDVPRLATSGASGAAMTGASRSPSGITLMDGGDSFDSAAAAADVLFMPNVRLLDEFSGLSVDNSVGDLSQLTLVRVNSGVAYLKLTETSSDQYQAWLTHVIMLHLIGYI